jgi:hypothetical protein
MALSHAGTEVLREPRRFVGLVSDYLGPHAPEVHILYHTVGMGYVEGFADAADAGTPQALRDVAARGAAQLEAEFDMRKETSRSISLAIALAISDFLGIAAPDMPPGWDGEEEHHKTEEKARRRRKAEEEQRRSAVGERIRHERKLDIEHATVSGVDPSNTYAGYPISAGSNRKFPRWAVVAAVAIVVALVATFLAPRIAGSLLDRWDVEAVSAGRDHTVGLLANGTVVATGSNDQGRCDVSGWQDIKAVSAGWYHTVGLFGDGSVVATGDNERGQCDVSGWHDVVALSAGNDHTVALLQDGTAVATGRNDDGQCDVSGWRGVTSVSAGYDHTIGLLEDGTVEATGDNEFGQCDVSEWHDVKAVSAGRGYTVGLLKDGTVVATGYNVMGQCNVYGW